MAEMARTERPVDPSRETIRGPNTDYLMDNGLVLRIHEGQNMYLSIRLPPATAGGGQNTPPPRGQKLAEIKNLRVGDKSAEIRVRLRIYELAKRLQPSTMQALAAIRDTVTADAREQGFVAPMTPPRTPRPGAPRTPFPYPMTAAPRSPLPPPRNR
jgi:hypothetical protein